MMIRRMRRSVEEQGKRIEKNLMGTKELLHVLQLVLTFVNKSQPTPTLLLGLLELTSNLLPQHCPDRARECYSTTL
ncbi:hypothetical protein RRG08_044173 [Elysia crispata]|uniref:Uncharacterized protein n=1 Tax=Elysia crispata TaxID=231223 RepID=A0AAE0XXE3_9GAST|nr:hypothetical protein RRG08_044173 [Elysia crispata]